VQVWQKSPWFRRVVAIAILFWLCCCALALQRYYNFYPTYVSFDQGIFNQVYWNSLHGRFFQSSLSSTESIAVATGDAPEVFYHRLGQHFTPALMLWLPLYALFPSPAGLSVLQVTIVAASGLVLYALARHYHPPHLAGMIAVSFYCANAVIGPTLANFHDLCQIPLYIFGLLLAMEKRWWWLFWLLAGLTLLVREDAGVVLFSVGFYLIVSRRYPQIGLAVCTVSLGYMLTLTNIIMPLFSRDISQRFMIEQFGQFIEGEEASTLDVIWAMVSQPWLLIIQLFTPFDRTISYLLGQWLPLVFIPAISPSAWMLAGFPLLQNLLRQDRTALSIDLRYAMTLVPGLFYGAILWWSCHSKQFTHRLRRFWVFCLVLAVILTLVYNPNRALSFAIPDSFVPWVYTSPARQWQHAQSIRALMAQVPDDASVSATTHIVSHLSNRREVVRFPELRIRDDARVVKQIEYLIVDLWQLQQYQIAFDDYRNELQQKTVSVEQLLSDQYGLIDLQDGVLLMQLRADSNPVAWEAWLDYQQEIAEIFETRSYSRSQLG